MPLITVIIPAYQAEQTLAAAIESVITQTFTDFEVVVINDGSTDRTCLIADQFAESDKRIRVLHLRQNIGAAAAMNHGWQLTDTPYVAVLDSDDIALPERFALQLESLEKRPEISVLGGGAHFIDSNAIKCATIIKAQEHQELRRQRWYDCPFIHPTVMMRRSFLERTGGYTSGLRLGEDYDLWMRGFLIPDVRYANLPTPLIQYRTKGITPWQMVRAGARVRHLAGRREGKVGRGLLAAARILAEGAIEHTRIFQLRDRCRTALFKSAPGSKPTP